MIHRETTMFRLQRSADWTEQMHTAADRMENAMRDVATAEGPALEIALHSLKCATKSFDVHALRLDKKRRPEFYARSKR